MTFKGRKGLLLSLLFTLKCIEGFQFGAKEMDDSSQNISLSYNSLPYHIAVLNSRVKEVRFTIWNRNSQQDFQLKINLVVEKLRCDTGFGRFLKIQSRNYDVELCSNINNMNNFESLNDIYDGDDEFIVKTVGDWTNMEVTILATVYCETIGSCANCPYLPSFSCNDKESARNCNKRNSFISINSVPTTKLRCIPIFAQGQGERLLCDGHANCGQFCSADESEEVCSEQRGKDECRDLDCTVPDYGLMLTLIIIGVFILVGIVYMLLMLNPTVRDLIGIPFLIRRRPTTNNTSVNTREEQERTRWEGQDTNSTRSVVVYVDTVNIATVSNSANDFPPSYDALDHKKKQEPEGETTSEDHELPSFSEAINILYNSTEYLSSSGNGLNNPAFVYISENDAIVQKTRPPS